MGDLHPGRTRCRRRRPAAGVAGDRREQLHEPDRPGLEFDCHICGLCGREGFPPVVLRVGSTRRRPDQMISTYINIDTYRTSRQARPMTRPTIVGQGPWCRGADPAQRRCGRSPRRLGLRVGGSSAAADSTSAASPRREVRLVPNVSSRPAPCRPSISLRLVPVTQTLSWVAKQQVVPISLSVNSPSPVRRRSRRAPSRWIRPRPRGG